MNHDKYDNDILKQLKRIADNLEKIEKHLAKNETKEIETTVDQNKTLDEQGLPSCWTCIGYNKDFGVCDLFMNLRIDLAENTCCTEWRKRVNENYEEI